MIYTKNFAKKYDRIYGEKFYKDYSNFVKRIVKAKRMKNPVVFDIGCGTGRIIKYFNKWKCFGIEPSKDMARIAEGRNKEATILVGKFNNKIKEKFDVIISTFDTVNYITKDDEIKNFFKDVKEHIKESGVFIFDFNTNEKKIPAIIKKNGFTYYSTIYNNKYWRIKIVSDDGYTEYHRERFYSFNEIERMIKNAGLEISRIYSDFNNKINKPHKEGRIIIVAIRKREYK